jgi:serine/threonine protein kinase/DNA-binding CsgD family transcriptional regulator
MVWNRGGFVMSKEFAPNTIIANKYHIEQEIGKGGLGSVYLATDLRLKRKVALKTLLHNRDSFDAQYGKGTFEQYLNRFEQEATISSYFTANPNIITVYGLEQDEQGNFYLIMEYLEGGSLAELLRRESRLPVERACEIALDICYALSEIHRHASDIVHRDLKPSNILLRKSGQAVVADFGIAQVGHASRRAEGNGTRHPGSPPYMSPEQQSQSDYLAPASDLYALGLLLYEMLTGRMYAKTWRLPPSLENKQIPLWLDKLVAQLLERQPSRRLQQAEEIAALLKSGLAAGTGRSVLNNSGAFEVMPDEKDTDEKTTPLPPGGSVVSNSSRAEAALSEPLSAAQLHRLEKPEGTMNTRSTFYIERPSDQIALETIQQEGVTITIKGPRQMGKSSLLLRVREAALQAGKRVALFDFQLFDKPALSDASLFFRQLCNWLSDELDLPSRVDEFWEAPLGNSQRTTRYLQRYLLKEVNGPLVLAMDEVDRTFDTTFRSDFFGMLRSWHNSRQTSPLWQVLDLVLVTSTEPYQLIEDLNQSPFNVGEVIELVDFNEEQVAELNRRHGTPLSTSQIEQLMSLLSGHPYLVRRALYLVASGRISSGSLFSEAISDRGPFGDHLRNQLFRLHERPELMEGMRQVIQKNTCPDERIFFRLRGAGLVKRLGRQVVARCQLYAEYFRVMSLDQPLTTIPAQPINSPIVNPGQNQKLALAGLSERELEVLRLVATGLSNVQIANKLVLSSHTINSHLTSIYSKLEVTSRTEAVRYALEHKLV